MRKNIVVHVGPPKTGSSAIQSWLNNNSTLLAKNANILYPTHDIDINGVSSGQNKLFLGKNAEEKSIFLHKKFQNLLDMFESSSYNTLLLSSEYFFYQIPDFINSSSNYNLTIVAYIRPEYEFIESVYNQSVKRGRQHQPISIRNKIKYTYLDTLIEYIERFGNSYFQLRAYGSKDFFEKSIIFDFLTALNLNNLFEEDLIIKMINSSYSFDCLEFKRWINSFEIDSIDSELDSKLQSFDGVRREFSLLPKEIYSTYKEQSLLKISSINALCPIVNFEKLAVYISNSSRPPYMHQELYDSHLKNIVSFLCKKDLEFSKVLYSELINKSNITKRDSDRLKIFCNEIEKYNIKPITLKSIFNKIWKLI